MSLALAVDCARRRSTALGSRYEAQMSIIGAFVLRRLCLPVAALLLLVGDARQASATTISIGTRIDISPTMFAIPIEITDAADVISWQFDLTYDSSDVQVNTGCDPFAGDVYCSVLTGPVTEGNFFASAAPFNLLIPGFIDLDPVTLAQSGLLSGVNGAFGGSAPLPLGSGTLAFVEFTILGDGGSVITVDGSTVSAPEPGTLALFTIGLLPLGVRRLHRQSSRR
jgi:hypothetical protein